jgi:hypothetical protein
MQKYNTYYCGGTCGSFPNVPGRNDMAKTPVYEIIIFLVCKTTNTILGTSFK